jgi:phytoene dehydrogenase-like protein
VSNADPQVTYGRLVDAEYLSPLFRLRLAHTRYSVSAISLFAATDLDLRALGFDSGNYWSYASDDIDGIYRMGLRTNGRDFDLPPGLFLTVTTLKDPSKRHRGHHTIEAFTFVPWEPFRAWADTRCGDRPAAYDAFKRELQEKMVRAASRLIPGLADHLVFSDLGTPLTNQHYLAATGGNLYGTDKRWHQVGPLGFQVKSPIRGLYLCGASTVGHGVMGATFSGLVAAASALRCRIRDLLGHRGPPIRIYPSEDPAAWPAPLRERIEREQRRDGGRIPAGQLAAGPVAHA